MKLIKRKSSPWYEELTLTCKQKLFLQRLLGIEPAYESIDDVETDFKEAFNAACK